MKLLIDVGNTRLKCALWDGTALRDRARRRTPPRCRLR
jgi:pantothenate kinase type III